MRLRPRGFMPLFFAFACVAAIISSCSTGVAIPPAGNGPHDCNNGEGGNNTMFPKQTCAAPPTPTPTPTPSGAPTPTPTPVPTPTPPGGLLNFQKIYANAQSTTACGGGWNGFSKTTAQDVFYALEMCNSDAALSTMLTKCPSGGNCRIVLYLSPSLIQCGPSYQNSNYTTLYNNPGTNDAAFLHSGSPPTSSNRLFTTGGSCTTTGGTSGGTSQMPVNIGTSPQQQYVLTNYEQGASWNNNSTWNWLFFDNLSQSPEGVIMNILPAEWPDLAHWNSAVQGFVEAESPYYSISNSLGPGGGSYPANNASGANSQLITNWAVSDKCNGLTTTNMAAEMAEKSTTDISGSNPMWHAHNVKILLNTASQHWATSGCLNTDIVLEGFSGGGGTTSLAARMLAKVLEGLMEPNAYDGLITTSSIETELFSENVNSLAYQSVFPESELVETTPLGNIHPWCWGGNAACDGNGQASSNAAFGNGCYAANGDIGGATDLAKLCGSMGNDVDGGTAPVYAREFTNTYRLGSLIGPSAYVLNMSTSANTNVSSLGLTYNYPYVLTPTGNEIPYDPLQAGTAGPLCNPATNCTGAYGLTAIQSSQTVPHCIYTSGVATMTDAAQTNGDCAVVLIGWNPAGPQLSITQQCSYSSTSCPLTSVPTSGDILIAIGFDGIDTPSCNTGWTQVQFLSAVFDKGVACSHLATGTESTALTPFIGTVVGHAWEVRNQDKFTAIDAVAASESTATGQNPLNIFLPTYHDVILGGSATNQGVTGFGVPTNWAVDSTVASASGNPAAQFGNFTPAGVGSRTDIWSFLGDSHVVSAMEVAIRTTNGLAPTPAPSPTPTPTPGPTPTPTPTPAPTPTPTPPPCNVASYHGVQVFACTDLYYNDISTAAVDPNSATIISNMSNVAVDMGNNFINTTQVDEAINLATNTTTVYPLTGSHSPPKAAATPEPWASPFIGEKTFCPTCSDGHWITLNTQSGKDWEDYQFTAPSGGSINVGGGHVWNLNASLASQYGPAEWTGGANAADLPFIAGALISDRDAYGNALFHNPINHAGAFYAATTAAAAWGYVRPANSSTGVGCSGTNCYTTHLIYGDRLRLKASALSKMSCYNANYALSSCPQASAIVDSWIHYGIIFEDTDSSSFGARMFNNPDGTSSWNRTDVTSLNVFHSSDFDVLRRTDSGGLICPTGHTC